MTKLFSEFKHRFNPTWTSLLVGWRGIGQRGRLVAPSDISEFASEKLGSQPVLGPEVTELADFSGVEADRIDALVAHLASLEHADYDAEVRKWIICLLEEQLKELPTDPLYGLLALTEFWSDLDFPDYSPHRVQGRGNQTSPNDYYTKENYRKIIGQHKYWINKEARMLSRSSPASEGYPP
jgi:hypothetical protein